MPLEETLLPTAKTSSRSSKDSKGKKKESANWEGHPFLTCSHADSHADSHVLIVFEP